MLYQLPSKPEKENQFASNGNNDGSETENVERFHSNDVSNTTTTTSSN